MSKVTSLQTPHPESEIEWWYFHGLFNEKYPLMICFWRYRSENGLPDGLMASYSLTTIDNSHRVHSTFIDESCFRQVRSIVTELVRHKPDPFLESFLEETDTGVLFQPYRYAEISGIVLTATNMRIRVGPCSLCCDAEGNAIHLEIDDTDLSLALDVDGAAQGFAMGSDGSFKITGKRMHGWTKPRLRASGFVTRTGVIERVSGVFWFDHQWGDWSFSHPQLGLHYPEWIYFAAVLDDGRSLVLYQHKSSRGDQQERRFAYIKLQEQGEASRRIYQATIIAHDTYESPRTNNLYEYGWTVELPEINARIDFQPFHSNHEIHVFTRLRGILEVGCRLSGQINGASCRGWGFVEVFGDTTNINEFFWGQKKINLKRQIDKFLPRSSNQGFLQRICQKHEHLDVDHGALDHAIFAPLWSMLDRMSKGWRSTWSSTCYYALGGKEMHEQVSELLPVTELIHMGSLVVDDFQDGSRLRRGRPTLYREVGADLAINAGCFCYFLPLIIFEDLKDLDGSQRARIYAIIANSMRQGHLGQAMDLMWSKGRFDVASKLDNFETTRAQLIEQYQLKTGSPLEAIARISGVLADAPGEWVEAVAKYSRVFGIVFQIIDDVIGIRDGKRNLGKDQGEDVHNGRLNMVLLHALGSVAQDEREHWISQVFGPKKFERFQSARKLIDMTNSIERCMNDAESLLDSVSDVLQILPSTDARIVMRSVPRWLLQQQRQQNQAHRRANATKGVLEKGGKPCVS